MKFNINLISDTNDLSTVSTGCVKQLKTSIETFLSELYLKQKHIEDIGVNNEYEIANEIINQVTLATSEINILTNRLKQINWQPINIS